MNDDAMVEKANKIRNAIGDILEKEEVENGVVMAVLSQMLYTLMYDCGETEAETMLKATSIIHVVYSKQNEEENDEQAHSRTTH